VSKETPDRLKEFRSTYEGKGGNGGRWVWAQLVIMIIGFAVVTTAVLTGKGQGTTDHVASDGGLSADQWRAYAGHLAEKHMPQAAISAYATYLKKAQLDDRGRAQICLHVARLAIDAEDYETALTYLYQAEILDAPADAQEELGQNIALCLDKLGRTVDLRRELRQRTAAQRTPKENEVVLAEFAGQVITHRDLELEIENMPPAAQQSFTTPEQQSELLQNMVAERLLLERALRLELDKDPAVTDQLNAARDTLIVRQLLAGEVEANVTVTPEDTERFYRAEISRFTRPASASVHRASAQSEEAAKALSVEDGDALTVVAGRPVVGPVDGEAAAVAILAADPGAIIGPFKGDTMWYVYRVRSKTDPEVAPFESVRDQAARMFRAEKEREFLRTLLAETIAQRDVKIYPERIAEAREQ
jgi:peptidyl-prolyl cis-trans isomerase C